MLLYQITHQDIIEIDDSDSEPDSKQKESLIYPSISDQPSILPEIAATTSFHQRLEPSLKYAFGATWSAVPLTAALVFIPLPQQLHEPSSKTPDTETLSAVTHSVT